MSTELGTLEGTGSRGVDMIVTRYWGGITGECIQLTAEQEDGDWGYVQLSLVDFVRLIELAEACDEQG